MPAIWTRMQLRGLSWWEGEGGAMWHAELQRTLKTLFQSTTLLWWWWGDKGSQSAVMQLESRSTLQMYLTPQQHVGVQHTPLQISPCVLPSLRMLTLLPTL